MSGQGVTTDQVLAGAAGADEAVGAYVPIPQAARALRVSERTVRRWLRAGRLRGRPHGRTHLIWLDRAVLTSAPAVQPTGVLGSLSQEELAVIRDQWLVPVVERLVQRIGVLERGVGYLMAERDALREQLAALGQVPPQPVPAAPDTDPVVWAPGREELWPWHQKEEGTDR